MTNPDNNSLYVLICSLAATVISSSDLQPCRYRDQPSGSLVLSPSPHTLLRVWLPKDAFAV